MQVCVCLGTYLGMLREVPDKRWVLRSLHLTPEWVNDRPLKLAMWKTEWVFFSTHFSLSCIFQEIVSSFSLLLRQKKPKESFFVLLFTLNFMFNSSLGPRWVHLAMFPGLTAPHRPSAPTFSGSHLSEEPSGAAPALWAALSLLLLPTQALFPHSSQTHFVRTYRVSWNLRHCWSWAVLLHALPEKGKLHQLCRCQVRHFPLLAILKCEGNVYLSIAETW